MEKCKSVSTPMDKKENMKKYDRVHPANEGLYGSLIGCIMYLTTTRSSIIFPISILSRFQNCASELHMVPTKRVLRHLKGTFSCGIKFFKVQEFKL